MSHAIDTETIETPAGTYTVNWHADEGAEQPYDSGFGFVLYPDSYRWQTNIDHDEENLLPYSVHEALKNGTVSGAAIVRYLRLKGFKAVTIVNDDYQSIDADADRTVRAHGVAWAPQDATDPEKYVETALAQWRAWAEGDVFGYEVTSPNGRHVDGCSGYYGFDAQREYTLECVREAVENDVADRTDAANLVGAGFVGLI